MEFNGRSRQLGQCRIVSIFLEASLLMHSTAKRHGSFHRPPTSGWATMSPVGTYLVQHSRILLFPNTTSSFLLVREGRLVISLRREIIKSMKRSWRLNLMAK